MNWLERARYEIRESGSRPTANTAEGNPTAVMAVPDPVICADSQACAHNLEDQTSQRAHREIQKSMQTPTANTAERSPTAVMAVSHPVICADSAACAGSGGAIPAEVPEFRRVPEEFAVELRFDGDDLLETSTPPADAVLDLLLRHKIPSLLGPNLDGWTAEDWQAFFDERAGIVEHDGGFPRPDAEMSAFEDCVDHRLALHPPVAGEYGYCLRCGTPVSDRDKASVVVTCVGGTTGRLHASVCARTWKNRRRWEARTALRWLLHRTRTMEVERTAGGG